MTNYDYVSLKYSCWKTNSYFFGQALEQAKTKTKILEINFKIIKNNIYFRLLFVYGTHARWYVVEIGLPFF